MSWLKNTSVTEEELIERLKETSIFLGKLLAIGLVFQAVLYIRPDTYGLQAGLATLTASILSFIGLELEVQGAYLIGSEESYFVNQDCLGWKSAFAFFGLTAASSQDLKGDMKFIILGISAILFLNLIRVLTTIYLSYYGYVSFDIIHTVLWRWGLTVVVLIIWTSWLFNLGSRRKAGWTN